MHLKHTFDRRAIVELAMSSPMSCIPHQHHPFGANKIAYRGINDVCMRCM